MHAIRWLAIGLLGAALALAGCRSCDQPEQPDAAGGPAAAPAAAPAADAGAEPPQPAADEAAAAAPEPGEPDEPVDADELREKLAKLSEDKKLRPGLARRMAGIPEPTAAEMADPKLQHLNEATRRAHIIMVKAQQRMMEMYPPGDGPPDPQIDEAEIQEKLEAGKIPGKAGPGD